MRPASPRRTWLALAIGGLAAAAVGAEPRPAGAEPLAVGARIDAFRLDDQHGESRAVDASTRVVLFSRDMDGGRVIREVLEHDGAGILQRLDAVYVTDVHRMPGLVRRIVAMPRMRKRPYPVLVDPEGDTTRAIPSEEGRGTVLFLESLEVRRIEFVETPEALRSVLGADVDPEAESGAP